MAERIKFYFDPGCPWCYQTSRWAKRLEALGKVELSWGIFCLEIVNNEKPDEVTEISGRSAPALRTAALVEQREGTKAVGTFYTTIGERVWGKAERLNDPDVIRAALTEAGLDAGLHDEAMADDATMKAVIESHRDVVKNKRAFGVPTMILDDGDGPALFGPVIYKLPPDDEAVELFEHALWLTRYENFAELKRTRTDIVDLEAVRIFRERRAQQQQEQQS
jgi:predicted DsbA family dithiol-disulfide isomerase